MRPTVNWSVVVRGALYALAMLLAVSLVAGTIMAVWLGDGGTVMTAMQIIVLEFAYLCAAGMVLLVFSGGSLSGRGLVVIALLWLPLLVVTLAAIPFWIFWLAWTGEGEKETGNV